MLVCSLGLDFIVVIYLSVMLICMKINNGLDISNDILFEYGTVILLTNIL